MSQILRDKRRLLAQARYLFRRERRSFVIVTIGTLLICFSLEALVIPYQFAGAGVTGIGLITNYLWGWSPAWIIGLGNAALLLWSWKALSLRFALWTVYVTTLTTLALPFFGMFHYPVLNNEILAAALCGVVDGIGCGLLFQEGASSGGTDVVVMAAKKRWGVDVGSGSFWLNIIILFASLIAVDLEKVLMGGLFLYVDSVTIDTVLKSFDRRTQVLIISTHSRQIADFIMGQLDRSATILPGRGAYSGRETNMLLAVMTRRQSVELKRFVSGIDPQAFIILSDVTEVVGLGFKRWNKI